MTLLQLLQERSQYWTFWGIFAITFCLWLERLMSFNWFSYLCYLRCSNFMIRYLILYAFISLWPSCFAQLFFNIQPKYSVSCFFFKNSTSSFSSAYFAFFSMSVPGNDMLLWLLLELLESNDNFDFNFKE